MSPDLLLDQAHDVLLTIGRDVDELATTALDLSLRYPLGEGHDVAMKMATYMIRLRSKVALMTDLLEPEIVKAIAESAKEERESGDTRIH